jgi:mannose-1-phosphate guanylyltransferase/mannose-1-phosphate guanylyltransferase/mannose-6-phosphate isomerase
LTWLALNQDPETIVGSFHSDHVIQDQAAFQQAVEAAYVLAEQSGQVVTLGIQPTHPATGYGYLQLGDDASIAPNQRVTKFIEKPNLEAAEALLAQGQVAWNAGMFFFPAKVMAEHFSRLQPEMWQGLSQLAADLSNLQTVFEQLPKISIDYAIMEKLDDLLAVPYAGDWADVGSWEDVAPRRANKQSVTEVAAKDNHYVSLLPHAKRTVFLGVDDLIAVDTPDALLIMKKGGGQGLKQVVQTLKDIQAPELVEHSFEERPWGRFEILLNTDNFKSKRLLLLPGGSLSYQRHQRRNEEWTITSGEGTATLNDVPRVVKAGDHVTIPIGTKHRLYNHSDQPLELIEVQTGTYFGEDDIERFSDQYGRV